MKHSSLVCVLLAACNPSGGELTSGAGTTGGTASTAPTAPGTMSDGDGTTDASGSSGGGPGPTTDTTATGSSTGECVGDDCTNCELDDTCVDDTPTTCGDGTCDATDHCHICPEDCGECAEEAPTIVRGPYLQKGAPDSLVIKWRTDTATTSAVAFGQDPAQLVWATNVDESVTEHEVTVGGLTPGARYYYAVGAIGAPLVGGDAEHRFATSPSPGTEKPTRLWIIGDSGEPGVGQQAVRDAYVDYAGDRPANLWLMLGDNAYEDGTDDEFQAAVFDPDAYQALLRNTMLWPTIGNHERVDAGGAYLDVFALPENAEAGGLASASEYYYSFDYGFIHFVCLDSDTHDDDETAMAWLRNDLQANDKTWLIAFWHHPPYSNGSHNSDMEGGLSDMRENYLPILEEFGVDLVFTGHSHSYERSVFLYGHYGDSSEIESNPAVVLARTGGGEPADGDPGGDGAYAKVEASACPDIGTPLAPGASCGTVYSVVGSSSKVSASDFPTLYDGGPKHPAQFVYDESLGSVVVDIEGDAADVVFLNSGSDDDNPYREFEITDQYRIEK